MQHLIAGTFLTAAILLVQWENKLKQLQKKFWEAAYSIGGVDVEKLFRHYDRDNSGELSWDEFRRAVRRDVKMKESDVPDVELREVFDHVDSDKGGTIGLAEFKSLLHVPEAADEATARHASMAGQVFARILEHADEKRANLLHFFHRFDPESSGGLNEDGFRQMMLALGMKLKPAELEQLMDEMDRTGNGFISTKEFSDRVRLAKKDQRAVLRTSSARSASPGRAASPGRQRSPRAAARSPTHRSGPKRQQASPISGAMTQSGAGFVQVNKGQMSSDGLSRTRTTAMSHTRTSPRSPTRSRTSGSPSPRGFVGAGFGSSSPRRL